MAAYLNKARNNILAAETLVNNGLYVPSAHPAYYSSFLMMKYVLAHYFSIDYKRQDKLTEKKDSHKELSKIALPLLIKSDAENGNNYLEWYNKLKMMRNKADYRPESIGDTQLKKNFASAKGFMNEVTKHFNIV